MINNKRYIGKKVSNVFNKNYLGSGVLIRRSIEKYGFNNFKVDILRICRSNEELNSSEIELIKEYNAVESDMFYNLASGGEGFSKGSKFTEEHKNSISKSLSGKNNPMYGSAPNYNQLKGLEIGQRKGASDKLKKKLSEIRTNCNVSEETREKLRNNQLGKRAINNGIICKYVPETEVRNYLSNGWIKGRLKGATTN